MTKRGVQGAFGIENGPPESDSDGYPRQKMEYPEQSR